METFLTKTMTIVALICFLVVGAAATAILGRDSVPAATPQRAVASCYRPGAGFEQGKQEGPAGRRELRAGGLRIAADHRGAERAVAPGLCVDRARRYRVAEGSCACRGTGRLAPEAQGRRQAQPQPQKNYALLSDVQIAGIKDRLKLSSSQESYWPPVETALRAVARKIHAGRQANPTASGVPIDPESEEVQQLKSAAMPLLFQLREDQKNEVRSLARIIGLEKVAAMI